MEQIRILMNKFEQNYLKQLLLEELSKDNVDINEVVNLTNRLADTFKILK